MMLDNPYQNLFWDMIRAARDAKASDIHIQPEASGVNIRFRIFGDLTSWKSIDDMHRSAFLQEAKRLAKCSLAVSGRAQDSRLAIPELCLDLRVSLVPSLYGEKMVLRLLDQNRSFTLDAIGLDTAAHLAIQSVLNTKTGVALITGPTGSGKTTLLYSALSAINRHRLNIITIEDPVEYTFSGITQIPVSSRLSMTDALRAILRQDPDIILLGEIRDAESAALCFQAASTGHFVLSTLHANSAKAAAERLSTLGIDHDLIRSCLRFTSAQRLLPKLCLNCRIEVKDSELAPEFKSAPSDGQSWFKRKLSGCSECYCGATGRVPILEYIDWQAGPNTSDDTRSVAGHFFSPSLQDGATSRAQKGEVDIYDAIQVA